MNRKSVVMGLVFGIAFLAVAMPASAPAGPLLIWGDVYTAGDNPQLVCQASAANCQKTVGVRIAHLGETKWFNTTITSDSQYAITIGADGWAVGDDYQIWLGASAWGNRDDWAYDRNTSANTFSIGSTDSGSIRHDLRGETEIHLVTPVQNLKPLVAVLFAIILIVTALLFLVFLPRQAIAVEFTGKSKVTARVEAGKETVTYKYDCSYATPTGPVPIGDIAASPEDVELFQTRLVSVSRVVRKPDGSFTWSDPRVVPLKDQAKQLRAGAPGAPATVLDTEGKALETVDAVKLEGFWRSGGKVSLHTNQEPKAAISSRKMMDFLVLGLPLAVTEGIIGVASAMTGLLAIPADSPMSAGLVVNLLILILGIIVHFMVFFRMKKPREGEAVPPLGPSTGAPAPAETSPPMDSPIEAPPMDAPAPEEPMPEPAPEEPALDEPTPEENPPQA